jgi:hypothetical protein
MKLSTSRGNDIREYYLSVEELMKLYVEYDKRCEMREREEMIRVKSIEIIDLKRMMQEMAKTLNKKKKKVDDNVNQLRRLNSVISQNNDLQQDVTEIGRRLGAACSETAQRRETRTVRTVQMDQSQLSSKRQKSETGRQSSRAIRAQIVSIAKALRVQRLKDPMLNVILEIDMRAKRAAEPNRIQRRCTTTSRKR